MYIYIYRLYCIDESIHECYIGSTNNIKKRIIAHKTCCNNITSKKYNYKLYTFIRAHGGFDNWLCEIIDAWECEDGDKEQIEQLYISTCEPELNSNKSCTGLTKKEYDKQYGKQWKAKNKEKIKQYRIENKEKRKQYDKKYRAKNKDELNRKKREKYAKNK